MIGIDTNVLVRYLTCDDPEQAEKAEALFQTHCTSEEPGFVPHIVLCELVWVLKRSYKFPKSKIVEALWYLLNTLELRIEAAPLVRQALQEFEKGKADFSDYLIGAICRENGCRFVATFDQKLKDEKAFHVL